MKKLISIALLLAMVLGLFAGCGKDKETATDLQNAVEYLTSMYQTAGKDEAIIITEDLDVLSSVVVDGNSFAVEWAVEITEGAADSVAVAESSKDNHVKLDIPLHSGENILFTATATVSDAEGNTESVSFNYMVEGVLLAGAGMTMEELVEAAYALDENAAMEGLAILTGVVTMINTPYDDGYKNLTCTIVVDDLTDMPIKCYRLKGEGADTLAVGDTITVSGTLKNYNGTIEFDAGCLIDELIKSDIPPVEVPADPMQIVQDAYALGANESLPYEATLTGVITSVDTPYDAAYQNVTVTITVAGCEDKPIKCYRLKGEGADTLAVGNTITVTGILTNYNGTVEFAQGCVLSASEGQSGLAPSDPLKVVDEAYALAPEQALPYTATLTGLITVVDTAYDASYQNITVTITVAGREAKPIKCFRMKGAGADQLAVGDTVTVSGTLKNFGGVIEFDDGCTLVSFVKGGSAIVKPGTEVEIVDQAYKLQRDQSLPYTATLTGKVTYISESYNAQYKNISVVIQVPGRENLPLQCYRMKGVDADKVAVGDTITVTGTIKNYNGMIQFDQGCNMDKRISGGGTTAPVTPETDPLKIVDAAYALAENTELPYSVMLTGKVTAIEDAYDEQYQNISVVIQVAGRESKPILVYRLKGQDVNKVAVGDTITVSGTLKNYYKKIELVNGIITGRVSGGGSAVKVETDPLKIVDMAYALAENTQLAYDVTLTGRVTKVEDAYNAEFGNITVSMVVIGRESKPIKCYRMKGTGVDQLAVNDTISVKGRIKNYNGTIEFDSGCEMISRTSGGGVAIKPQTDPASIMAAAKQLAEGEEMSYEVTLSGKVLSVDEAYDAQYGNVTVTIAVSGANNQALVCYRMKGDGVEAVAAGDTITLTGRIKNHYGTIELVYGEMTARTSGGGSAPVKPNSQQTIVDEAYALQNGGSLAYTAELTGTIVGLKSPYDAQYQNMTVIIAVAGREDKPIECYRMKGDSIGNHLCVGDTITVSGKIKNYNGTVEFDSGCKMISRTPGNASVPGDPKQIVDAAFALGENQVLPYFATLTGVVKSIDEPYTDQYKNVTLTMTVRGTNGSYDIVVYRMKGNGADSVAAGNTITVTGAIKRFVRDTDEGVHEDKVEFDSGCVLDAIP